MRLPTVSLAPRCSQPTVTAAAAASAATSNAGFIFMLHSSTGVPSRVTGSLHRGGVHYYRFASVSPVGSREPTVGATPTVFEPRDRRVPLDRRALPFDVRVDGGKRRHVDDPADGRGRRE